jgi:plasmid stabilization system protein ParE
MSAYVLTPLAKADIFDIWSYIADDSQDAADRVEQARSLPLSAEKEISSAF